MEDRGRRDGQIVRLGSSSGVGTAGRSLPHELKERTGARLRIAATVYAAAAALSVAAELALSGDRRPATWVWTAAQIEDAIRFGSASVIVSLAVVAAITWVRLPPERERLLGHVYWVVTALFIGLGTSYEVHGHLGWVGVWILAGPLVLPSRPRHTLLTSLLCVAAIPTAYGIHLARGLVEPAPLASLASFVLPNLVCAGLAYGLGAAIYRLGRAVERQRDLGAYRLVERIGAGGMGEVWRAEHRTLVRPAAIKLVRRDQLVDGGSELELETVLRRFEREAQATALLTSPHTIEVFDFGVTDDGTFYIVMELLEGMDLYRLLERSGGALPPARAAYLLRQVAHSLADAHHAGVLHRDIKPANVFVCQKGLERDYVKVLDFGLARETHPDPSADKLTVEGAIAGTPGYMSPEAAMSGELDERSDVYAFGCLAYRVLAGRDIFEGGLFQQLARHMTEPAPPLSEVAAQPVPAPLAELVMQCLEKEIEARPRSMEEVLRRLDEMGLAERWTGEDASAAWESAGAEDAAAIGEAPTLAATPADPAH